MSNSASRKFSKAHESVAGLRFLVVDDQKFSRHIIVEALKWLDATNIAEASDAMEAISMLKGGAMRDWNQPSYAAAAQQLGVCDERLGIQKGFDCIVTDFNMKPANGLHLLKAVRTGEAKCTRDTPVLMITGFSDEALIAAALRLDVNAFVLKPVSRDIFSQKLGRVLMRPVEPQSVEAYDAVKISECDKLSDSGSPAQNAGPKNAKPRSRDTDEQMLVMDIGEIADSHKSGKDLILGEDIVGVNGAVIVSCGTRLSRPLLEKLRELHDMGMMPSHLKIQP